eukprot:4885753-Pleurochrysis_carterae.AAC.1
MAPSDGVGETFGGEGFEGRVGSNRPSYGSMRSVHKLRCRPSGRRRNASSRRSRRIRSPSATSFR